MVVNYLYLFKGVNPMSKINWSIRGWYAGADDGFDEYDTSSKREANKIFKDWCKQDCYSYVDMIADNGDEIIDDLCTTYRKQ